MRDAPNPKKPALTADLSPDAWVHWDLDDDLATPLNRQPPTIFSVGADLFSMPVRNPASHQAQVFGVMAVAGAVGKFQGPEDGFTQRGSWTASDGREVPIRWPKQLSGPHVFMIETRHLIEARRVLGATNIGPDLQTAVSGTAYNWAHDRVNAGDISDRIERGDIWPLPNVWIGTTARMQSEVDHAGHLAQVSTAHRFLRLRLLDEVSLRELFGLYESEEGVFALKVGSRWEGSPDWVIISAPDGPSPQAAWVETIIAQCRGAGVPVWVDSDIAVCLPTALRVQEVPQIAASVDASGLPETEDPDSTYPARFAEQAPCLCNEEPHPAWCPAFYRQAIITALEAHRTPAETARQPLDGVLSDEELAAIEARHAAATEGEWLRGEAAQQASKSTADWGAIYVRRTDPGCGPMFRLVADTYAAWLTSKGEEAECRACSRAADAWHEPAQIAANAEFIASAHNTDIPRLIASVRTLRNLHHHSEQVAVTYTVADVDTALREILGHRLFDALRQSTSWSRPHMMKDAAAECFTQQRPEDQHSAVLRAAVRHMNKTGVIMPEDVRHEG